MKNIVFFNHLKVFFAQTLFRFEGMELSQVQTRQLLDKEKMKELHFDFDQTQIINNVIEALDFIDKVDLKTISIDSNTYIKLNEILAKNQALETGKFRDQEGYIPCIENPIPPVKAEEIEKQLNMLDHVDKNNFKIRVPIIFSELIKAQPFFDGNKRTTLFICNLALLKKDLGVFYIKNDKYPEFEEKLTDFYTGKNRAVQVFLEENCIYKKNELTPKLTNPELQENNIKRVISKMYDYKKIIKNITQIRKLKNITQEELANKSGIKRSNLSRLEQGKVVPKIDTLCKIYNALSAKIPD